MAYYLLRDSPVGDFSYGRIVARYNADLANTLGNLVARVTALVASRCGGTGPAPSLGSALRDPAAKAVDEACRAWDEVQLAAVWRLVAESIWQRLGLPGTVSDARLSRDGTWGGYPGGLPVTKFTPLFPRTVDS